MRKCLGFTLIELLVVIGIIGVLLAILLPVTQRVRQQSVSLKCKAQLADIGKSMVIYLNANQNRFPPARMGPGPNPGTMLPSLREFWTPPSADRAAQVWSCPADEIFFSTHGLSYAYNQELGTVKLSESITWKVIRATSGVPVAWDAGNDHGGPNRKNFLMADGHVEEFLYNARPQDIQIPQ